MHRYPFPGLGTISLPGRTIRSERQKRVHQWALIVGLTTSAAAHTAILLLGSVQISLPVEGDATLPLPEPFRALQVEALAKPPPAQFVTAAPAQPDSVEQLGLA
ncbi:MAG: hypothetical protein GEU90_19940 [Gemmatimonas sp.]|nr:hypothetical protein [Gemmatimonas sp.]